jgi:P-type E1-E2 ATPase
LGTPLAIDAITQLLHRRITMELLFTLGVVAALATSVHSMLRGHGAVYFDVVCVLVIVYSVGRAINLYSRQRALSAVQSLTAGIERARLVAGDDERLVPASTIALGDCVRVFPGELIPIDGTVIAGSSFVRQTPFTGEWTSTVCGPGRHVLAGTACEDGTLLVEATAPGAARRVDRLAELIDSARRSPTSLQRQADRLVRWFVPLILVICGATFLGWMLADRWNAGLLNAMAVLLVACPCAAGLATPLALWSTLGELARRGLVASSGDAIERLAGVDGVIFDKTGTLADEQLALRTITTALDDDNAADISLTHLVDGLRQRLARVHDIHLARAELAYVHDLSCGRRAQHGPPQAQSKAGRSRGQLVQTERHPTPRLMRQVIRPDSAAGLRLIRGHRPSEKHFYAGNLGFLIVGGH